MTAARWDLAVDDQVQTSTVRPLPTLVSLHFLRSALRRRWWVCALFAVLGLLASVTFLVVSPAYHAKASLVLAHDPQVDASRAMATDLSLLRTRAVASKTIAELGLTMTPDELLESVTAEPVSSELLSLTISAPSDAEAIRRLTALTSIYLNFRAEQLTTQSNVLIDGTEQRIEKLQGEVATLSRRIEVLSATSGRSAASKLSDAIAQRANFQGQIETLQQSVEDATLRSASVVASSRVIDPAAVDAAGAKRRVVLALLSGFIGGAALGCGIVLFLAITSDRLRRRSDVAAALEVRVPVSVGKIAPIRKPWLWLPHMRTLNARRAGERQRLAHAIQMELPVPDREGRLAVACIDNADEVGFAVAAAATDLATDGWSVAVIDLTERGNLEVEPPNHGPATRQPTVLRPSGVPTLVAGAADLQTVGHGNGSSPTLESAEVIFVLADLDPSIGADHLTSWADRAIVAVSAGRSSAERVRTAGDLVRTAGLDLRLAALLGTDRTDNSSGIAGFDQTVRVRHQKPLFESQERVDEDQDLVVAIATVATAKEAANDDQAKATAASASGSDQELDVADVKVGADSSLPTDTEQSLAAADQTTDKEQPSAEPPADDVPQVDEHQHDEERQPETVQPANAAMADIEERAEPEVSAEVDQLTADEQPDEAGAADEGERRSDTMQQADAEPQADHAAIVEEQTQPEEEITLDEHEPPGQQAESAVTDSERADDGQSDESREQAELTEQPGAPEQPEVTDVELHASEEHPAVEIPAYQDAATEAPQVHEERLVEDQQPEKEPVAEKQQDDIAVTVEVPPLSDAEQHAEAQVVDAELAGAERPAEEQPIEIDQLAEAEVTEELEAAAEVTGAETHASSEEQSPAEPQAYPELVIAAEPDHEEGLVEDHQVEQQADTGQAAAEEAVTDEAVTDEAVTDEELTGAEEEAVADKQATDQPDDAEQQVNAEHGADAEESAELEQAAYPASGHLDGWNLYIDADWDGNLDSHDAKQPSAVKGDADEAHINGAALTTSKIGNEPVPAQEVGSQADVRAAAKNPASNGQVSNGDRVTRRRKRWRNSRTQSYRSNAR